VRRLAIALSGLLALAAASGPASAADPTLPSTGGGFGTYQLLPLLDDSTAYAGPATPTSLDDVSMTRQVDKLLTPEARAKLAEQGFVVVPEQFRLFHSAYDEQYYAGTPVYVTTDAAYNAWHEVFDKTLRDLEGRRLSPALGELLTGMLKNARSQQQDLTGTALESDAARVVDLLAVAVAELGLKAGELSARARQEQALIDAHDQSQATSPILGTVTDYTLFAPRGHYTRTKALGRYFVAMSVLGQHAFRLPGSVQTDRSVVSNVDGLRLALLASRTLVGDPKLEALWHQVFDPTAFLVGVADDYTPFELAAAVEAVVPGGMSDPLTSTDDDTLDAVAAQLVQTRPVQIDAERPSVRLMGTRFVLDSWILDQLITPNVSDAPDLRILPSVLDLAAAFGSDFALSIQDAAGETAYPRYPEQMQAMREAVAARPDEAWGDTVYDAWLAAIAPMWLPHGLAFPDYMRTDAWAAKDHQTGFGSHAELRHDTILYTKQFVGEMGDVAPKLPKVRNWVEPDPVAFGRLSAMATLTRDGLASRDLLPKDTQRLLTDYITMVDRLGRLAADELAGKPIETGGKQSDPGFWKSDNEWLRSIGGTLEGFWWRSGDQLNTNHPIRDDDAAIIADIGRGVDLDKGIDQVLEVGTGRIDRIFVLVPDDQGTFHVASGGVYSFYEFPWPTSKRLTDEQWWKMLRSDDAPERPAWEAPIFP
jgi:hypothetical protein